MAIVSIRVDVQGDPAQTRYVTYTATDHTGAEHTRSVTTSDPLYNPLDPAMQARVSAKIADRLEEQEFRQWLLERDRPMLFVHLSKLQFLRNARRALRESKQGNESARVASKLLAITQGGAVTITQMRTAWNNWTPAEVDAFLLRIADKAAKFAAVEAVDGLDA